MAFATIELEDASHETLLKLHETRRLGEERGTRFRYDRTLTRILKNECRRCGSTWKTYVDFKLAKSAFKAFQKEHTHGVESFLYGSMLWSNVEIQNGYFEKPNPFYTLDLLLHPNHECGKRLNPQLLIDSHQKNEKAINNFWDEQIRSSQNSVSFKARCPHCLRTYKVHAKFAPIYPDKPNQIAELFQAWQRRDIDEPPYLKMEKPLNPNAVNPADFR